SQVPTINLYKYTAQFSNPTVDLVSTAAFGTEQFDFALPVDLDLDGDLDLILAKTLENGGMPGALPKLLGSLKASYNIGAGRPQFNPAVPIPNSFETQNDLFGLQIDDFDQDGLPDLVVAYFLQKKIVIYKNTGTGFVHAFQVDDADFYARDATIIDIDKD